MKLKDFGNIITQSHLLTEPKTSRMHICISTVD